MYQIIPLEEWPRRAAFHFFKNYDDPFFNITAPVDVTVLHARCKAERSSFFLNSLYFATRAANAVEAFRLRILGDQLVCYDTVHAGSTIFMEDQTFQFGYFDYVADREQFVREGRDTIAQLKAQSRLEPRDEALDLIHFSVIPWISFSSFKHARRYIPGDTIPKIVFGKYYGQGDRLLMPVSVEVHHAMMDGYHAGQFFEKFQTLLAGTE